MKKITLLLALVICASMLGQELKKKKNSELFFEESYTIDKSSKKRQGDYVKLDDYSGDTLVKGRYDQDKKVGIWAYMGEGNSPFLTFDHDEEKVIKFTNKRFTRDSIQVKTAAGYKMTAVDHPAIYLGFKNEIERMMRREVKPPPSVFNEAKPGSVMVSFEVTEKGKTTNFKIETSYDNNLNKALEKAIVIFKDGWFPAAIKGVPVASKMYMVFNFSFIVGTSKPAKLTLLERGDLIMIHMVYYSRAN